MAFQAPTLPSLAAATTELWPSMATTLLMPFRAPSSPLSQMRSKAELNWSATTTRSHATSAVQPAKFELPEFLRDPRVESALVRAAPATPRYIPSVLNIHNSISGMSGGALLASNPVTRRLYSQSLVGRSFSTTSWSRASVYSGPLVGIATAQRRSIQTGGLSRNLLAHMEQTANRNPTSATAQNAFYQALVKANMPAIIVERYRSGRFASNAAADEAYEKALSLLSPGGANANELVEDKLPGDLTPTQLQAVKQALAARSRGGNLAVNKTASSTGGKDGPLHVVVDESFGNSFFRWVKFILWFCLITYLSLVIITMLVESLSVFKRAGGTKDFDWAKDRVIMGAERKTMIITPEEKRMTAYHEAGHALLMLWSGEAKSAASSLYKVTVLARGPSLGHTAPLPQMDKYSFSVQNYRSMIDVALGGKLAEEIVYGVDNVSSGASSDLKSATHTAFTMVAALGMSSKLGHMDYASRYENLSSETKAQIEAEVQRILNESYERCRKLLTERRKELDLLAQALVEYETLDKSEVEKVIRGEKLPDRISVPKGPMVVPVPEKTPAPGLPSPGGSGGGQQPPPPPPAPPAPGGFPS
ncbi:ATP-dependent metallopeptidase HflB [Apiospora marii]|uniref:ATP-dependent metallopeptidase HflB n=1 Tax=Apiospora marii TaxID=335849 RepID=UPI0031307E7E